MSRKITVVLEIQDQEAAKEFWDAHVARRNIHGCRVVAVAAGDLIEDPWDDEDDRAFNDEGDDMEII